MHSPNRDHGTVHHPTGSRTLSEKSIAVVALILVIGGAVTWHFASTHHRGPVYSTCIRESMLPPYYQTRDFVINRPQFLLFGQWHGHQGPSCTWGSCSYSCLSPPCMLHAHAVPCAACKHPTARRASFGPCTLHASRLHGRDSDQTKVTYLHACHARR